MASSTGKKGSKKAGRQKNSAQNLRYKSEGRREKNKARKIMKHNARYGDEVDPRSPEERVARQKRLQQKNAERRHALRHIIKSVRAAAKTVIKGKESDYAEKDHNSNNNEG